MLLTQSFKKDGGEISSTKFFGRFVSDRPVWTASVNGKFSIKTAWESIRQQGAAVIWHRLVWFSSTQTRFAFITWLVFHRRLTTKCRLASWGAAIDTTCSLCLEAPETIDHLLFQCSFSKKIWKEIVTLNGFQRGPLSSWQEEIDWMVDHFEGESLINCIRRFSLASMIYRIWGERNYGVFKQRQQDYSAVLRHVIHDTRGRFSDVEKPVLDNDVNKSFFHRWQLNVSYQHSIATPHVWSLPPSQWVAINCDGSVCADHGGYGAIGRDSAGKVLFAIAGGAQETNILVMELMAIRGGLQKARALNPPQVQVRSDSQCAVQMITGLYQKLWYGLGLIEDIHCLHDCFQSCGFSHQVREVNKCADFLASFVQSCEEIHLSPDCLPETLSALVRDDVNGKKFFRM
ncbi:uncharacterized protein LOC122643620 [Telopea speciosissima]|uniref:uncharacterized protein LOC122643620 n=1 Tax=Telopea speciosissima TaxID=54955 RepID=UPI001CC76FDD|nr:uncharacterized protein LOC122643620 [Telopea speciosissima]